MHKGTTLQYLHTDRLPSRHGSIAQATNQSGGHPAELLRWSLPSACRMGQEARRRHLTNREPLHRPEAR
ncbi:MAG: hypothetical protein AAF702_38190 [Chloroflexota bacterium]